MALKEILPDKASDTDKRARFVHEAEITGNLEHPGIVPVYGLGRYQDGRPFYAMRFIKGDSLREAIQRFHKSQDSRSQSATHRMELRKLIQRFIDICDAVEYAHSRGVLHRDLKPGNIMLGKYGETLVVDWGLAKTVGSDVTHSLDEEPSIHPSEESDSAPTQMGAAVGTPAYMSPEQAVGRLDLLGPATDVFGLGATLYCLLTGRPPYDVKSTDIMRQLEEATFVRPRALKPGIPRPLEAVCLHAMAREPNDRYQSPGEMSEELQRWLADEPVRAWREPIRVRLRRWVVNHLPIVAAMATTVILLVAIGTAAGVYRWRQREAQHQQIQMLVENATAAVGEDDWLQASRLFGQAAGIASRDPSHSELRRKVEAWSAQADQHSLFLRLASESLSEGVHALRDERKPDQTVAQSRKALALYGGTTAPNWEQSFAESLLTDRQVAETKETIGELVDQLAIRLALYDTHDEAGRIATEEAIRLFELADTVRQPPMGVWMARMLFHRRLGNDDLADQAGEKMTDMGRQGLSTATDRYLMGIMILKLDKNPTDAAGILDKALAIEPNNYGAHFARYHCALELGDAARQRVELAACLALRPKDADLYYFRGVLNFSEGKYRHAQLDFVQCVRHAPEHSQGHYWQGRILIMDENWAEAEEAFSQAVELERGEDVNTRAWRALVRAKQGKHHDAAADLSALPIEERKDTSVAWRRLRTLALNAQAATSADPPEKKLADQYVSQAMETLRQLADAGYFAADKNMISLLSSDLDALRSVGEYVEWEKQHMADVVDSQTLPTSPALLYLRALVLTRRGEHERGGRPTPVDLHTAWEASRST